MLRFALCWTMHDLGMRGKMWISVCFLLLYAFRMHSFGTSNSQFTQFSHDGRCALGLAAFAPCRDDGLQGGPGGVSASREK